MNVYQCSKYGLIMLFIVAVVNAAYCGQKSIPELIDSLGVEDRGNHTCSTACGILLMKKDEAVPYLQRALTNSNKRVRYYSVRTLGSIDTKRSREVLIRAFCNGLDDVREHAAYALTWHPHQDAEQVYIDFLGGKDQWHVWRAIKALGEIKSKSAIPHLAQIRDNPKGWRFYYAALVSLRKIESQELPQEVQDSLDFLRKAKYSHKVNAAKLATSVKIIKANLETVLPDVFEIYLLTTRGESKVEPNSRTILRDSGELAHPYVKIALRDEDENMSRKARQLVTRLGWEMKFKKDL